MGKQGMFMGVVSVVVVGVCAYFAGGGLLEPAAGPGPTMHTLDELYAISAGISQPQRYVTRASGSVASAYVRFEGVVGEAKDGDHQGWSDIITFHQGQKLPIEGVGAARQVGPAGFDDISVIKRLDKASAKLAEAVCRGTRYATVDIDVTKMTESGGVSYLKYRLKNVFVSSYNIVGSDSTLSSPPMEEVSLNFEEITMIYTERDIAGQSLGEVEYTWTVGGAQ